MTDIFCSAPWTSLFIDTTGEVRPCCAGNFPLGNINTNDVVDIINGPTHLAIKQGILNGVKQTHCENCYSAEQLSGDSTRLWFNRFTPITDPRLEQYDLQMIDIRWSNHCNLRCLYCGSRNSSSIAEFQGIREKKTIKNWQEQIMQLVRANILTIKEVFLLGGEPLLMKENLELVDQLTDQNIVIFTNLSTSVDNNKIFQKLLTKPNVGWHVSLEQTGKKFEFVRNNASWDLVLSNLHKLKDLNKRVAFTMQYCIYSAVDLHAVLKELTAIAPIKLAVLTNPESLNILNHVKEIKQLAIEEIDKIFNDQELLDKLQVDDKDILANIKTNLLEETTLNVSQDFIKRQQFNPGPLQFKDLWPNIWDIVLKNS